MYRYQSGAPATPSRPTNPGSNPSFPSRFPIRPPSNATFRYPSNTTYRPPNSTTYRTSPNLIYLTNNSSIPRFPYRSPSIMSSRPGPSSTRAAARHPYSRPTPRPRLPRSCPPASQPGTSRDTSPSRNTPTTASSTGRKRCEICSFSQKPPDEKKAVWHDHFSSKSLRELLGVEFALSGAYYCPSCKTNHSPYPTERTKVVLSDSTLHNFFAPPTPTNTQYEGDTVHVDYVTIPGATLETIFHAFKIEYSYHTRPMDVYIVAGYNDLVRNTGRDMIVKTIKTFCEYVLELTNEDMVNNTITIGTLLYPPQLAWFRDDGPEPEGYVNQREKIDWINGNIDQMNLDNGMPYSLGIHKHGTRVSTSKTKDMYGNVIHTRHMKTHRWQQWRETEKTRMLHLSNERRFVLGRAINEYFVNRT